MTNEEKFIDSAEAYLNNTLSRSKKNAFESQLNSDVKFASEFDFFQVMHAGICESAKLEFKAQLKDIHKSIDFSEQSSKKASELNSKSNHLKTILFSVLAIIAIALTAFFLLPSTKSTEEIIKENSKPPILALLERSSDSTGLKKETAELWSKKNYKTAIPGLENLAAKADTNNSFHLALAYSYYSDNQNNKAKIEFQKLINAQDFLYADHALWYSALIALKENKQEKAVDILKKLSLNKTSDRNADALKLLEELRK